MPAYRDEQRSVSVTASFGVVSADFSKVGMEGDPGALITRADELLYQAKSAGRDRVEFDEFRRVSMAA